MVRHNANSIPAAAETLRLPSSKVGEHLPSLIRVCGNKAKVRFVTFFTDDIRNPNTREAYYRAAFQFFSWCDQHKLSFEQIESFHVSAYIEHLMLEKSKPTVKLHLAAIRKLYDWLVVGQILESNPAHAVRGPKHVVSAGLTPILDTEDMKKLLDSIDTSSIVGLRDRALIAAMTSTFARVQAIVDLDIDDYYLSGKSWFLKLEEKNGKTIEMPVSEKLEEILDEYIDSAGGAEGFPSETPKHTGKRPKCRPIFRTTRGRSRKLTGRRMSRQDAWRMIKRRARLAGVSPKICNHSFRGAGITNYLENGGSIDEAQRMAGHSDPRTTGLYDRRNRNITRGEVERIDILGAPAAPNRC